MSLQTCSLIVCVFLAQMAAGTGVQFVMERHPDSYICGHLQCLADFTHSDNGVFSFVEMTIYDITRVNSELRLASVSTFDPDLYVDTTKSSALGCTGTISRVKANLTVQLRYDIDCLYGVYKCQLDMVTMSGHSEVLTEVVRPEYNHSCSRIAEVLSHFNTLTDLLKNFTIIVNNQTAQINRLVSQSDDQTAVINILVSQSDDQRAQLVNQTAQINSLAGQSDDLTALINILVSQSDNQTAQLVDQTAHHGTQTAQLVDQKAQLHNISQRYDLDQADQKQRHEATENRLKLLQEKLDNVEKLLNLSIDPVPNLQVGSSCHLGMPHKNAREKFLLFGRVLALCDTETDSGGWVIIQRRVKGDVDFYRGWDDYKRGFGTPDTDFWIGNDIIHHLTSQGYNELRIDITANGTNYFAHYTNFSVANESSKYRITINGYSGNVYDSMAYHNGGNFSTRDGDNDLSNSSSCSLSYHASWWYKFCHNANLNGVWDEPPPNGISWLFNPTGQWLHLTFAEMKIRY